MEHSNDVEEKNSVKSFTIFGEPIIKTQCQRNTLITSITGGIISGLATFLFTSKIQKSCNIAFGSYFTLTLCMSCYCSYMESQMRKNGRMIKAALYELNKKQHAINSSDPDMKFENV